MEKRPTHHRRRSAIERSRQRFRRHPYAAYDQEHGLHHRHGTKGYRRLAQIVLVQATIALPGDERGQRARHARQEIGGQSHRE
jgi:hypothetical protein